MKWHKIYQGMAFDQVFAVIARKCGLARAEVLTLWLALIDHAHGDTAQGTTHGFRADDAALALDIDPAAAKKAVAEFRMFRLIAPDGAILRWRPRWSSTGRVRAHRARKKAPATSTNKKQQAEKRIRIDADTPAETAARRARMMEQIRIKQGALHV